MQTQLASVDFNALISIQHNQAVTTSVQVAQAFGKQHAHVLRKIDEILEQVPEIFGKSNFGLTEIETKNNLGFTVKTRAFELTKNGFILLVMGFTGKTAMAIKIAYIGAFDYMLEKLSGGLKRIESDTLTKTTPADREGLREAVHYLVGKRHLNFNEAYKLVHQRFNVHSIEELPAEQLPQAVQYVHALALDTSLHGEVLDALHPPAAPQGYTLSHGEELALNATFCYLQQSVETNRTLFPILEAMGSKFLPPVYDAAFETGFAIGGLTRLRQHCHQTEVDLRQRLGI